MVFVKISAENVDKFVGVEKGAENNVNEETLRTFATPIPSGVFAADVTTFEDFVIFLEVFVVCENHADLKFGKRT